MTARRLKARRRREVARRAERLTGGRGPFARLREVLGKASSALDTAEAEDRAALTRSPGYFHLGLRLSFVSVVVLGLLAVLLVRLWSIQVIHTGTAEGAQLAVPTRDVPTPAPRGPILARGGQPLATDKSEAVLTLKTSYKYVGKTAVRVANATTERNLTALIPGLTVAKIRQQLDNEQYGPYQPVPVVTGLTVAEATVVEENPGEFPGASVSEQYVREYPQDDLAAQMIGYLGPFSSAACQSKKAKEQQICEAQTEKFDADHEPTEPIGQAGLEYEYDKELQGKAGEQLVKVSPADVAVGTVRTIPATEGDTLVLNMDLPLEQTLSQALSSQIKSLRTTGEPADWGAAVVFGPKEQVLAAVSLPSYDDNEWVGGISKADYDALQKTPGDPLNDYVLAGLQPPGSTFKIATATAALDDGLITPSYIYNDTGSFPLPGSTMPLHDSGSESFGPIDVTQALAYSSDDFFYNLGAWFWDDRDKYGETPIQKVAGDYGFGESGGIDLPGDEAGQVDSPELTKELHDEYPEDFPQGTWYLGSNVEMAFGQGMTLVTPLEEAEAYSTFANGGTRYAPEMAAAVVSPSGKVVKRIAPQVEGHVSLPSSTYDAMLQGFEGAVTLAEGTATEDFNNPETGFKGFSTWEVGGKTGTADVAANSSKQPTAWFVAFAGPKSDPSQRYTIAVEIDQAGFGADASAPVAVTVLNYLYSHGVQNLDVAAASRS